MDSWPHFLWALDFINGVSCFQGENIRIFKFKQGQIRNDQINHFMYAIVFEFLVIHDLDKFLFEILSGCPLRPYKWCELVLMERNSHFQVKTRPRTGMTKFTILHVLQSMNFG